MKRPHPEQRTMLLALQHVQSQIVPQRYRGFSRCRICGCTNGSAEYETRDWVWPEGLSHYVAEHNVRLPEEFAAFLLSRNVPALTALPKDVDRVSVERADWEEIKQLSGPPSLSEKMDAMRRLDRIAYLIKRQERRMARRGSG